MSVKPIEKMNDAELDAELRRYGVDPENWWTTSLANLPQL